jgi:hypothetical protein
MASTLEGEPPEFPFAPRYGASLIVAFAATALYAVFLCQSVFWGDSAQFAIRAAELQLEPGARAYPLFRFLGWLAGRLTGDPALGANSVSALFAGATAGLVFLVVSRFSRGIAAPLAAASALALSHTCWSYALVAEVYSLHTFLLVLGVLLAYGSAPAGPRAQTGLGVLTGLSLLHHRLFLFSAPVLFFWGVLSQPAGSRRTAFRRAALGALLGALPFLLICGVDLADTLSQGETGFHAWLADVLTGGSVNIDHMLGTQTKDLTQTFLYLGKWVFFNLPGAAILLALLGFLDRRVRTRGMTLLLALLAAANLIFPLRYGWTGDQYAFLTPLYPLLAVACGLGVEGLRRRWGNLAARVALIAVVLCPLGLYGAMAWRASRTQSMPKLTVDAERGFFWPPHHGEPGPGEWCRLRMERLPARAALFAEWGDGMVYLYLQRVEGLRPDVLLRQDLPPPEDERVGDGRECWASVMPIWKAPGERLGWLSGEAVDAGEGLFRVPSLQAPHGND